jgi:LysM repeat protein
VSDTEITRLRTALTLIAATLLLAPAAASASFPHVVVRGESLSSIAATDGLSVQQLAAANGLSPSAGLIAGSTIMIPAIGSGVSTQSTASTPAGTPTVTATAPDGDGDGDEGSAAASSSAAAPGSTAVGGGYVVQPGDTLSAIAARAGTTVAQLAADNGLDPNGLLIAGSMLRVPGAAGSATASGTVSAAGQPVGAAAEGNGGGPPYPTPQTVSASEVGQIASSNGVPPSLAEAIGWQESGFNNDLVSSAGAVGVMQITPGTWDWINRTLVSGAPLAPADATSNVLGGVLMLRALLNSTGGNLALTAGGYFQGLSSVQQNGLLPTTQQYVNAVTALVQQFGGG